MTIQAFDGCNILYRALSDTSLHAAKGMNIRQRYNTLQATDIWVFDGFGHNARRREIYPPYKMNRPPTPMNITAQLKLFKALITMSPATLIEVDGWEADDVLGVLARKGAPIKIFTNDMDYAQLAHLPNVTLDGVKSKDVPARWIPLYKATVGDSSDNIAGIPGFGPGAWLNLQPCLDQFERAVITGQGKAFTAFPVTPAVAKWLAVDANIKLVQQMLLITHFFPVPEDELNAGITRGVPDPAAANALLGRYLL